MTLKYKISVHGCDDSTYVEMELTNGQASIIELLAKKVTEASTYQCQPSMNIECLEENETAK